MCEAECLPRKELFEAWQFARRVRRRIKGGRIVDIAAGHGLASWLTILIDDSTPEAVCVDRRRPKSFDRLREALEAQWPRLRGRVGYEEADVSTARVESGDRIFAVHACGALTDAALDLAIGVRARLAVLPCCQDADRCDTGGLEGWVDIGVAVDATRAARLRAASYQVYTGTLPAEITPQNRLLVGVPEV